MKTIKLAENTINKDELQKLSNWIKSNPQLTMGPMTFQFEKAWAKWLGTKYSIFVNSGSSAILASFQGLSEMKKLKNKKIVIPALCWSTDFSVLTQLGYQTIMCDCNLDDLSVSIENLENIFKTYKPSALLLISVLGLVPDMKKIQYLCKKYNVLLIEDTCESLGSEFRGKKLGTFGFCSFFSLYYGHHVSTIEGGIIATNNRDYYNILKAVRAHGWSRDMELSYKKKLEKKYAIDSFSSKFTFYYRGFNLRPTEIQSFLGLQQLKKIKKIVKIRSENFNYFFNKLSNKMWKPKRDNKNLISNMGFPMIVENRKDIILKLKKNNVENRPLISGSLRNQPFFRQHSINKNKLKNADEIHYKGFYLPNHCGIEKKDINKMLKIIE